jgi:hypothetical protein
MCGFCGEMTFDGSPADTTAVARMVESLVSRGPDGRGTWSAGRVAFGHRRLSVIDLSPCGSQPMEDDEAIGIPVAGIDFLVPAVEGPDDVFVEADERPGLANHEPQPAAERFVDRLFPETRHR